MRALLSKIMTGSMVAGAALLVAACGGGGEEPANNTADVNLTDVDMGNDVTTVESTNAMDMNMTTEPAANVSNEAEAGNAATNGM